MEHVLCHEVSSSRLCRQNQPKFAVSEHYQNPHFAVGQCIACKIGFCPTNYAVHLFRGLGAGPDSIQAGGGFTCIGAGLQHQHCQISIGLQYGSWLAVKISLLMSTWMFIVTVS